MILELATRNQTLRKVGPDITPVVFAHGASTGAETLLQVMRDDPRYNERWDMIEKQFEVVHRNFIRELQHTAPLLTPTEMRSCILSKLNLSSKQQADILFISPGTIKLHRHHIRQKLSLNSKQSLSQFINAL